MAEDMGEKTELPTGKRISDARNRGQVIKSQDLAAAIELIGVTVTLAALGTGLVRACVTMVRDGLTGAMGMSPLDLLALFRGALLGPVVACVPIMLAVFVIAAIAYLVQFGPNFASEALVPKLDRLNPVNGVKQLFSLKNLVKTILNCVKLTVVAIVAIMYTSAAMDRIAGLPQLHLNGVVAAIGGLILQLVLWLLALLLVIGLADYLYQRWQYMQDLKMTRQEVTDERRTVEGDPLVKMRQMKAMRQIALQQIGASVPGADVVVTNPTHFSVALRYDQATMGAPRVVAKGADFMAMRIRQVAALHRVPIVERPPLARGLYAQVQVGQEVSPEFYQAVAELLAYVYRLNESAPPAPVPATPEVAAAAV